MESHTEFLARVTLDADFAAELRRDYTQVALDPADRAMLDFAVRLTKTPATMAPPDVEDLRRVGFDDRGILQITLIASWFNYINRVADALGVGRPG